MQSAISLSDTIETEEVLDLYRANGWSSAEEPEQLMAALRNSHSLVTARVEGRLVGLGNAISDGYLVVYFPDMLVYPGFQHQGVGRKMMETLLGIYDSFTNCYLLRMVTPLSSTAPSASSVQVIQSQCGSMGEMSIEHEG